MERRASRRWSIPAPIREALLLSSETLAALVRRPPPLSRLLSQMHQVGNRSLVFILVTQGFLGLILVYQACVQTLKVLPDLSGVGPAFLFAMVRTFGPTVTGLMVATRVGAGIAAELGSMTVTDQVEAMKVANSDPIARLVVPRFLACVAMMPVLWVFGSLVGAVAGYLMGHYRFAIGTPVFLDFSGINPMTVFIGYVKAQTYGIVIPILSAHAGFQANGGSEGVGRATTAAVVRSSFAVIVLDFVISTVAYWVGY